MTSGGHNRDWRHQSRGKVDLHNNNKPNEENQKKEEGLFTSHFVSFVSESLPDGQGAPQLDGDQLRARGGKLAKSTLRLSSCLPSMATNLRLATLTFLQPLSQVRQSYALTQAQMRAAMAMRMHSGTIIDTLEKGVAYPVVHLDRDPKLDHTKPLQASLLPQDALGPDLHLLQGVYEEQSRVEPYFCHSKRSDLSNRIFIVLGFKSVDYSQLSRNVLEHTWSDWTGARAFNKAIKSNFDLAKVIFYRRVAPAEGLTHDLALFKYVVLMECWNVGESRVREARDFVQRMRAETIVKGYTALYRDLGLEEENFGLDDNDQSDARHVSRKRCYVIPPPTLDPSCYPNP